MNKILAVNAGSSSLKFQLFSMPSEEVLSAGIFERIGLADSIFTITVDEQKITVVEDIADHQKAVNKLLAALVEHKIVEDLSEISGVGHRIVHGGEYFSESVIASTGEADKVAELCSLAPLHNHANLTGYNSFVVALPVATQVFVFDTAFHQTMEPVNYLYPIPYEYYEEYRVRRYGFHGTSHQYVSQRVAELIGKPLEELNIISCHLGNGASLTAIQGGKSIHTSMGFTPLTGVMMGTRSGDIDPTIIPYLGEKLGKTTDEVIDIFNKKSGMLGVSGLSSDARDINDAVEKGDPRAILTRAIYCNRIASYIGSYHVLLGRVDVILFTAGLGENACPVRAEILDLLTLPLGIKYDSEVNNTRGEEIRLSTIDSAIEVWVIPTNEELMIAKDTYRLMKI